MKIKEVLMYNDVIKSIIDNGVEISPLMKFKFLGIIVQLKPTVDNFEQTRNELIQKYGKVGKDGQFGIIQPNEDDYEKDDATFANDMEEYQKTLDTFNKDLISILESDIDITMPKFKANDIMNAGIPSDVLVALYDLIEE